VKFRIPLAVVDSGAKIANVTLKIGLHPDATSCIDNFALTGFSDHWTETDSSTSIELEPPPAGFGFDYRFSYPTAICATQLWTEDIHESVSTTQRDTFRIRIQLDATQGDDIHSMKFYWPTKTVLAQYADSIILIKSTGLLRFRYVLTQQDSAIVSYSINTYGNVAPFYLILQGPRTPPNPPTVTTIAPPDGATNVSLTPTFSWNAVPNAHYYRFQLARDSLFAMLVRTDSLSGSATSLTQSTNLLQQTTYYWRLLVSNPYGVSYYQRPPFSFQTQIVGSVDLTDGRIPSSFALHENYPNPFNPTTTIKYDLADRSHVVLRVYDLLGREVAKLVDGLQEAGYKSLTFDAGGLASGLYFYGLNAGTFTDIKKMTVMK